MSTTSPMYVPPIPVWHSQLEQQQAEQDDPPAPPAPPADPPAGPPPAPEPPKPGPPPAPEPVEGSPDGGKTFSAEYVEKLRRENAKKRTDEKAEIQKQIDEALANGQKAWATELGKKLGIIEADSEKTPDQIIAELQAERDQIRTERDQMKNERTANAERDAIKAAAELHKGNVRLVAAVLREDGLLKDIDPTADDYTAQVAAVVKAEIEKDASLLAVQVAPRSGSDVPPAGSTAPAEPVSVDDFRKKRQERRAQ